MKSEGADPFDRLNKTPFTDENLSRDALAYFCAALTNKNRNTIQSPNSATAAENNRRELQEGSKTMAVVPRGFFFYFFSSCSTTHRL